MAKPTRVEAAVLEALSRFAVPSETVVRHESQDEQARRYERLAPCRDVVTDDDFRRIVRDELDTKASRVVRKWLSTPARYLALVGDLGRGKTCAALWAIAEVGGRYMTADEIRRAYAQETAEAQDLRWRAVHCRLLVVDDVGAERDETQAKHGLHELVNARQGRGRRTILTGNLAPEELLRRYDPRTIDRVLHQGAIIEVGGESLRGKR